jgi:hypothetical protein
MRNIFLVALILITSVTIIWAHGDDDDNPDHHEPIDTSDAIVPENPTYYEHVKPLLELHCITCHTDEQIAGDIPLTSSDDVEKGANDIAFNVSTAYMPPWMPSTLSLPMQHNRSLSNTEIATLVAWDENGAPLGNPEDYIPPETPAYQLADIRADLTLQLEEPYIPDENATDDYRCFAFPLDIDSSRYVTGYEFVPDTTEMVHHGIVYLVNRSAQQTIKRRNFEDGRIGWSCYGGVGLSTRSEMIGTWAPGTLPTSYPDGTGFRVDPDDIVVIQMHYNLAITRQPDEIMVTLQLADEELPIDELRIYPLTAPVEIPCPTGVDGSQCNRISALDRVARLYGQEFHYFPDSLLQNCDQTLADYADNTGENATTYCDYPISAPITAYSVFGHMHELGWSFQLELNPDSDAPVMMLDIPSWDFHWQDTYQFVEPLQLQRGDVVRMTCQWDNTLSENPRYVVWGEGTDDEMCFGAIIILRP